MDTGNFAGNVDEAGRLNTGTLIEGMRRLRWAAANLGDREVLYGLDRLRQPLGKEGFPLISANLVYQDSAEPITQPSVVKTVDLVRPDGKKRKLRVGLLGLARMNPGLAQPTEDGRRIVTADPVAAARREAATLRKKVDMIVALVTLEPNQAQELARRVPEIDLVLGGFGALQTSLSTMSSDSKSPKVTRIVYGGNQGKNVGEVRVHLSEEGSPAKVDPKLVNLGRAVPDDPDIMDLVGKNRLAINEIHKREAPLVDAAKLRAMYEGSAYVGSAACRDCHQEEYRIWEESRHAHAFRILEVKHQDYNPDCVGCHTTGFRRPTGFLNLKSTPELVNVQCEACHGPAQAHPATVGEGYGPVGRESCLTCHTVENSPDFDPAAYRVKIRHWEEGGGAAAAPSPDR